MDFHKVQRFLNVRKKLVTKISIAFYFSVITILLSSCAIFCSRNPKNAETQLKQIDRIIADIDEHSNHLIDVLSKFGNLEILEDWTNEVEDFKVKLGMLPEEKLHQICLSVVGDVMQLDFLFNKCSGTSEYDYQVKRRHKFKPFFFIEGNLIPSSSTELSMANNKEKTRQFLDSTENFFKNVAPTLRKGKSELMARRDEMIKKKKSEENLLLIPFFFIMLFCLASLLSNTKYGKEIPSSLYLLICFLFYMFTMHGLMFLAYLLFAAPLNNVPHEPGYVKSFNFEDSSFHHNKYMNIYDSLLECDYTIPDKICVERISIFLSKYHHLSKSQEIISNIINRYFIGNRYRQTALQEIKSLIESWITDLKQLPNCSDYAKKDRYIRLDNTISTSFDLLSNEYNKMEHLSIMTRAFVDEKTNEIIRSTYSDTFRINMTNVNVNVNVNSKQYESLLKCYKFLLNPHQKIYRDVFLTVIIWLTFLCSIYHYLEFEKTILPTNIGENYEFMD